MDRQELTRNRMCWILIRNNLWFRLYILLSFSVHMLSLSMTNKIRNIKYILTYWFPLTRVITYYHIGYNKTIKQYRLPRVMTLGKKKLVKWLILKQARNIILPKQINFEFKECFLALLPTWIYTPPHELSKLMYNENRQWTWEDLHLH